MKTTIHRGGVDCLGLLMGVAQALDLRDKYGVLLTTHDRHDYSTHPDGAALYHHLIHALYEIDTSLLQISDIALFAYEHNAQHLGIISSYDSQHLGVIHAYAPARHVVEHLLDTHWQNKMAAAFRLPALSIVS